MGASGSAMGFAALVDLPPFALGCFGHDAADAAQVAFVRHDLHVGRRLVQAAGREHALLRRLEGTPGKPIPGAIRAALFYARTGIIGAVIAGLLFGAGLNDAITIETFLYSLLGAVILLAIVNLIRSLMIGVGFKMQRLGNNLLRGFAHLQVRRPPSTHGTPPVKEQVIHFINKKMPGNLPKKTARALLDIEDKDYVPIIRNPKATTADTEAVFYFPGCGSERLFSQVGLATQAMLWHAGVQTVLPPGYLCCGYPQRGSGQFDKAEKMITDNRVLFHRVANTLNYLDIKTVVVSCGTCYDQLQGYEFDKIFPGCRIIDIHEYLLEKGIKLEGAGGYLFHDPCHSPMKLQDPMKTVKALVGENVRKSERCCGESGTFGVTRPDIATQVRFRKEEELRKDEAALRASGAVGEKDNIKILTSCPSCLQGMHRYNHDLQNGLLEADYVVIEMANKILGADWMKDYVKAANAGGIERVLV
mgnify:CR=1 FL=1